MVVTMRVTVEATMEMTMEVMMETMMEVMKDVVKEERRRRGCNYCDRTAGQRRAADTHSSVQAVRLKILMVVVVTIVEMVVVMVMRMVAMEVAMGMVVGRYIPTLTPWPKQSASEFYLSTPSCVLYQTY